MCAAVLLRLAKNNERFLGTEMKKFIILLLVFSLLSLTSCGLFEKLGFGGVDATDICEIANNSNPTKITTEVSLTTNQGDALSSYYVTATDGTNTVFEYDTEKLATPEDSLASGNFDRIVKEKGKIIYKDGAFYDENGEVLPTGSATAYELKFFIDEKLLKDVTVSEDGYTLEAKVDAEDVKSLIGTDLEAKGQVTLTVVTNGVNLTNVTFSCTTASGNMTVRTSYTYNPQDLFPETEG